MKKVFISYCWDKYDTFVESLATKLLDEYDVIFDKWEIKHGYNMDFFMENSIREAEKVFILCEKEYVNKANKRVSGVGIETSIISPKVYRDTKQEKFIPVFLEGIRIKPDYMESIFGIEVNPNIELAAEKLEEFFNAVEGKSILEKPKFDKSKLSTEINVPSKINDISLQDKIKNEIFDLEVYEKILRVLKDDLIAKFIVKYQLDNFGKMILKFDETNQIKLLNSIDRNYVDATGYGGWSNYDLFGRIAYDVAVTIKNETIKNKAKLILEQCAKNRYNLNDLLDDFNMSIL
ncbi:toll/interleukin-1 receptor domain-containing protein [Clostridium tagluense]|uniref:toll/interleukin-1 receptor domain-containing protein n=1 Tax=Clostridium tagluense TaxID=360422 RepID=UPI001C6E1C09|nr:toll/interleukin-1 receptor domain-containing protein [Clostridium tagluense]MBW9158024.1 toll/interleukin-1 receptor domain-containing protein [Clostridium tagluense]WLC66452.1 toll/interleukin-1 receptor domain-containing protein [Clostridium tagluense]